MMFFRAWPLVVRNLLHHRMRLMLAVLGIGFAVVLMFMQVGFRNALFDSTVQMVRELDADLILFNKGKYALTVTERIPRARLLLAASDPAVQGAYPLYVEAYTGIWKQSKHKKSRNIRVLAFDLHDPVFLDEDIVSQLGKLQEPNSVLLDRQTKPEPFALPAVDELSRDFPVERSGKSLRIVGTFSLGTDFANDGNLLMSADNYAMYFAGLQPGDVLDNVDLGVVKLVNPSQANEVKVRLQSIMPGDTLVLTKAEFIEREISFWKASTPIGYVFFVGFMMGWIVGLVICYQIISRDVSDHLSEYATLKAMGYRPSFFAGIIFWQSIGLSVIGYVPGLIVSLIMYFALSQWTGLLMDLTLPRAAMVFGLTLLLCFTSGSWAIRGLLQSDPAKLF